MKSIGKKSVSQYKVNQTVSKIPVGGFKKIPPRTVIPQVPVAPPQVVQQVAPQPQIAPIPKPIQASVKAQIAPKKEISFIAPDPKDSTSTQIFQLTNQYRELNKLPKLSYSPRLSAAAQKRAEEIAQSGAFDHKSFLANSNKDYYLVTENLAQGFKANDLAFKGWVNSPTHQANLVNSAAKEIGIGYAVRPDGKVVLVQHFGNPKQ